MYFYEWMIWVEENHCHSHTHTHTQTIYLVFRNRKDKGWWTNMELTLSHVQLFVTPWTVAHQAPLSKNCRRILNISTLSERIQVILHSGNLPVFAHSLSQTLVLNKSPNKTETYSSHIVHFYFSQHLSTEGKKKKHNVRVWVKFYWGQNEDYSQGVVSQIALRNCSEQVAGKISIIYYFRERGYMQSAHFLAEVCW